jgi:hypothetical protein
MKYSFIVLLLILCSCRINIETEPAPTLGSCYFYKNVNNPHEYEVEALGKYRLIVKDNDGPDHIRINTPYSELKFFMRIDCKADLVPNKDTR